MPQGTGKRQSMTSPPFPPGPFSVIYADPPWGYTFKSPTGAKRPKYVNGVADYYPTMKTEEVKQLGISGLAAKDAVLFLWATVPMLPDAFDVLRAWGFTYKTMIVWHKLRCKGMGYWFRGHAELLLLGVRGNIKPFRSLLHNVQAVQVLRHSVKPDEFRHIIEGVTPGAKRIELFARQQVRDWTVWGLEAPSV